tara:strand:+ start:518 stop:1294 length:777 start_codon:yes stop_codon:yes gene_type:complete
MSLKKITYLSIVPNDSEKEYQNIDSIIKIGNNSSNKLDFGKKIIYTCQEPTIDPGNFEIKMIDEIPYKEFNRFVSENYSELFNTEYAINFHSDGFIQNQDAWNNDFLKYDYIGAPIKLPTINNQYQPTVGNGGFSLRSKKICEKIKELKLNNYLPKYLDIFGDNLISEGIFGQIPAFFKNEDVYIGLFCKKILDEHGFKIADFHTASLFATEHFSLLNNQYSEDPEGLNSSFGFHEINYLQIPTVAEHRKKIQKQLTK